MSQPSLSNSDIAHLYQILEQANKNYIKQSRTKEKPAFNILRVLSALRLLFPQSPSTLYNSIIFMTKNYDPQTHYQWKKAIEDLNANRGLFRSRSNYCRPDIALHTRTYQNSFNRSRANETQEHLQSKSYAQINIPHQHASNHESFFNEDPKEQSQTNAQTGKRMFYTKADSLSHVSKNHYISFQPYRHQPSHYDKQNVNSTNVQESRKKQSSYQYIEAIQRDLIRTAKQSQSKTPIDQSFIKKINSYESPYLYSKQEQEHDPIEEQMNARAKTFYQFNMQLKVLSSLQANSFVFQKAKQNQGKAKLKHRSQLFHKTFIALANNVTIQRDLRLKNEKADSFFQNKTYSKIFSVIKLMNELQRNQVSPINIQKLKKGNFQFILSLLFTLHSQKEEDLVGFNDRIMELIHSDQSNKLYLIVKYFGKHSWITQKNIEELVNQYKLSICKQVLTILQRQKQSNFKYDAIRQKNLKKQSFYALKLRWNLFACYKQKIKMAETKRNKLLLQKIMKSLLETVFSTKLYSKRCQYIQRKHLLHLKAATLGTWIQQARTSMQNRKTISIHCAQLSDKLLQYVKRFSFNRIKQQIKCLDEKISKLLISSNAHQKRIFLCRLRAQIHKNHLIGKARGSIQAILCKTALQRWKESTKKGKALSKIFLCIKINYFRQLVLPEFKYAISKVRQMHCNEQVLLKQSFLSLKKYTLQQLQRRQTLQQRLKAKLLEFAKVNALKAIKYFNTIEKKVKLRQVLNSKIQKYYNFKAELNKNKFIQKMSMHAHQSLQHKQTKENLANSLKKMCQKYFYSKLQNLYSLHCNSNAASLMVLSNRKKEASRIFVNSIQLSKMQKIKQLRKRNSAYQLYLIINQQCKKQRSKKKIANTFYNNLLKDKSIQVLSTIARQSKQVVHIAKNFQMRNGIKSIKNSLVQLRKQHRVRKVYKKYNKKVLIKSLLHQRQIGVQQKCLSTFLFTNLQSLLIKGLAHNTKSKRERNQLNLKIISCLKMRVMSRLQFFYVQSLIAKKYLYMAIKFRALKLSLHAFSALTLQKQPKRPLLNCHKLLAERLSTDLV